MCIYSFWFSHVVHATFVLFVHVCELLCLICRDSIIRLERIIHDECHIERFFISALGRDRVICVWPFASSAVAVFDLETSSMGTVGTSSSIAIAVTGSIPMSMTSANKQAKIRFS